MIANILIALANVEAVWLYYVLRDGITHSRHAETGLTRVAGFQIIISSVLAFVCIALSKRHGKLDFQKLAFAATAFAILGLCAAVVGAYPFPIGTTVSP